MIDKPFFHMRALYECGWNIFKRKGFSDNPQDISVNYKYLNHVSQAGINWIVIFWANASGFDKAWEDASKYAHSLGIKLARGLYGFCGGGAEYTMTEPNAPEHLLRDTRLGRRMGLCPFEDEARQWMASIIPKRLEPDIDGIVIEPAREILRNCMCSKCQELLPYRWNVYILNFLTDEIHKLNSNIEVIPYLKMSEGREEKQAWAKELKALRKEINHIFAWGMDTYDDMIDWLDADLRFEPFTKLSRVLLFPSGKKPSTSIEDRVSSVFRWCKMAADRGKKGYMFDYRIFGGREWQGHENDVPCTRVSDRVPASLMIAGEAMKNPYLDKKGQSELIDYLNEIADWDLDDPEYFYRGKSK